MLFQNLNCTSDRKHFNLRLSTVLFIEFEYLKIWIASAVPGNLTLSKTLTIKKFFDTKNLDHLIDFHLIRFFISSGRSTRERAVARTSSRTIWWWSRSIWAPPTPATRSALWRSPNRFTWCAIRSSPTTLPVTRSPPLCYWHRMVSFSSALFKTLWFKWFSLNFKLQKWIRMNSNFSS